MILNLYHPEYVGHRGEMWRSVVSVVLKFVSVLDEGSLQRCCKLYF